MDAFAYSQEDGQRIITTASLLDGENTTTRELDNSELVSLSYELKKLKEKDTKLDLNSITLSDYWRRGLIPRGLRIKKFPAFGSEMNTEFKQKWESILNKCSFDLILLLIEEDKKYREVIQQEIEEINKKIEELKSDQWINLNKKLTEDLSKFKEQIKQEKLSKFQRDERDYREKKVYFWPKGHSQQGPQRKGARRVSFNFTSEEEDMDFTTNGPSPGTSGNEQPPKKKGALKQQNKGQRKNERQEEGARNNPYYHTRHYRRAQS